jgi:hypothetical protein
MEGREPERRQRRKVKVEAPVERVEFFIDGVKVPEQIWHRRQIWGEYKGAKYGTSRDGN